MCNNSEHLGHESCIIEGTRDGFDQVESNILNLMKSLFYSEDAMFSVRVAIEEALANALLHGHHGDVQKEITVTWKVDEIAVEFSVTDQGRGYDSKSIPDPTADENLNIPSGRGLAMISAFMDEITLNEQGNCVFMKRLKNQ